MRVDMDFVFSWFPKVAPCFNLIRQWATVVHSIQNANIPLVTPALALCGHHISLHMVQSLIEVRQKAFRVFARREVA